MKKFISEFIGTAVLVLFGCGIAVVSGGDLVATALAFGLSIVAMAYVIGNISGCHINPAVSLAMLINKKMDVKEFAMYVVAQVLGAFAGAGLLYGILSATTAGVVGLGVNGYGADYGMEISLLGAIIVEIVLTFVFIYTILGVTSDPEKSSVAGIVIGLVLTFVHLLGIKLTGTSVNPVRSLAPAILMGGTALKQVWVFIVAPLCGSALAALVFKGLNKEEPKEKVVSRKK